ncbi:hypothetical protein [Frankia sp. AgB32]|uniref:hypothetical protein n=1 Tax=Frankia sp. AgB32 TaxID=631119 RepID=UPI00200E9FA6|nr:hypothetical protein [Frankia sp. AgB32]MCK9897057.1 hypothetical protein [Frankia sp. AgB32]
MATTSMQLDSALRDELAELAEQDFRGASLGEVVLRLVREYKIQRIVHQYEALRADPEAWASYQVEARLTDGVAGDRIPGASEEYPEYNR